jgi:hypothetical protein
MPVRIYKRLHVFGPFYVTISRSGIRPSFSTRALTVSRRSDGQSSMSARIPGTNLRVRRGG